MRFIALDVHRDFCEVAIADDGEVCLAGRVETKPAALELLRRVSAETIRSRATRGKRARDRPGD